MWDKGTNLHHALLLANRHFRKHPNAQPVLLIVTDGEPTSHLEPDGEVYFAYPPHPLTVAYVGPRARQRRPARRADDVLPARRRPGLARFIDSMARRVDGRVVAPGARRPRRRRRRLLPRLARPGRPAAVSTATGSAAAGSGSTEVVPTRRSRGGMTARSAERACSQGGPDISAR